MTARKSWGLFWPKYTSKADYLAAQVAPLAHDITVVVPTITAYGVQSPACSATIHDSVGGTISVVGVVWSLTGSSDVATIDPVTGVLTVLTDGVFSVVATSPADGRSGEAAVTVSLSTTPASIDVVADQTVGTGYTLAAPAVVVRNAVGGVVTATLSYSILDTSKATANATTGVVTGIAVGATSLRITAGSIHRDVPLTVLTDYLYFVGLWNAAGAARWDAIFIPGVGHTAGTGRKLSVSAAYGTGTAVPLNSSQALNVGINYNATTNRFEFSGQHTRITGLPHAENYQTDAPHLAFGGTIGSNDYSEFGFHSAIDGTGEMTENEYVRVGNATAAAPWQNGVGTRNANVQDGESGTTVPLNTKASLIFGYTQRTAGRDGGYGTAWTRTIMNGNSVGLLTRQIATQGELTATERIPWIGAALFAGTSFVTQIADVFGVFRGDPSPAQVQAWTDFCAVRGIPRDTTKHIVAAGNSEFVGYLLTAPETMRRAIVRALGASASSYVVDNISQSTITSQQILDSYTAGLELAVSPSGRDREYVLLYEHVNQVNLNLVSSDPAITPDPIGHAVGRYLAVCDQLYATNPAIRLIGSTMLPAYQAAYGLTQAQFNTYNTGLRAGFATRTWMRYVDFAADARYPWSITAGGTELQADHTHWTQATEDAVAADFVAAIVAWP